MSPTWDNFFKFVAAGAVAYAVTKDWRWGMGGS